MKRITLQAWAERRLNIEPTPCVEIMDLEKLRNLPPKGWEGIYFLWLGDELKYIGQYTQIPTRVRAHENKLLIEFDRYTCLEIQEADFDRYEQAYIDHYRPIHNALDGPWRRRRHPRK